MPKLSESTMHRRVTPNEFNESTLDLTRELKGADEDDYKVIFKYLNEHPEIKGVILDSNQLTDEAVIFIAKNLSSSGVTKIYSKYNPIGDIGAKALADIPTLKVLWLNLSKISLDGAKELAKNRNLVELSLSGIENGDEVADAFSRNDTITTLYLNGNKMTDSGAAAIATNTKITTLYLQDNEIGDEGAAAIAKSKNIKRLYLNYNQLTDEGIKPFMDNQSLTFLNVEDNNLTRVGGERLAMAYLNNPNLNVRFGKVFDKDDGPDVIPRNIKMIMLHEDDRDAITNFLKARPISTLKELGLLAVKKNKLGTSNLPIELQDEIESKKLKK